MPALFANNAASTLADSLTAVATTLTVATGQGARFPAVVAPNTLLLTLVDALDATKIEVVRCTAHTAASDSFTIVRAQEAIGATAATAYAFTPNSLVEARLTAGGLAQIAPAATSAALGTLKLVGTPTDAANPTTLVTEDTQVHLGKKQVHVWSPGFSTTLSVLGGPATNQTPSTISHPTLAPTTDRRTGLYRAILTGNTTVSVAGGLNDSQRMCWRGGANGTGGFYFFARVAIETTFAATGKFMCGLSTPGANFPTTGNPSTDVPNLIALACDAGDANFGIITSSTTGTFTKTALTAPVSKTVTAASNSACFDIEITAPPYAGGAMSPITMKVSNWVTGAVLFNGTLAGNLPPSTAALGRVFMFGNGTVAPAAAPAVSFSRILLTID